MTDQEKILNQLKAQTGLLTTISKQLDRLAQASAPASPNYRRHLSDFAHFDWTEINAAVTAQDGQGVSEVEWNLHRFTRRAGDGKFGKAIWFSRPTGKDDGDQNTYARLITFKDGDAEPVPGGAVSQAQPHPAPAQPSQAFAGKLADTVIPVPTIKPTDIYAPAPAVSNARQVFNQRGTAAVREGRISGQVFNDISQRNRGNWAAALVELEAALAVAV